MIPASWAIRTVLEINWSALIGPNETMRVVDGGIAELSQVRLIFGALMPGQNQASSPGKYSLEEVYHQVKLG
jgi:hypothetical protein